MKNKKELLIVSENNKFHLKFLFIFLVLQFPFRFETISDQLSSITKSKTSASKKPVESHKVKVRQLDLNSQKRNKSSSVPQRQSLSTPISHPSVVSLQSIKTLPLTIFDFNGSQEYYEHISPFIDTNALHLLCIHTVDFHQKTPTDIEEVFNKNFDSASYPIITQLFQILQLLCEKVTQTNGIMILPIATCIDLYDKRPNQDK